jgi:hypothetical protein
VWYSYFLVLSTWSVTKPSRCLQILRKCKKLKLLKQYWKIFQFLSTHCLIKVLNFILTNMSTIFWNSAMKQKTTITIFSSLPIWLLWVSSRITCKEMNRLQGHSLWFYPNITLHNSPEHCQSSLQDPLPVPIVINLVAFGNSHYPSKSHLSPLQ